MAGCGWAAVAVGSHLGYLPADDGLPPRWSSSPVRAHAVVVRVLTRAGALLQLGWDRFRVVRAGCGLPDSSQPVTEEEPMSGPGFTRPDLCSIRTAAGQEERAGAVRGAFSADCYPLADDELPAPPAGGIDRAIRLSTAAAVLAVAGIAAYVSYWHAYAVIRAHGETGITARLSRPRSTAWSTPARWRSCTRPGTGYRCPPWPAGYSEQASGGAAGAWCPVTGRNRKVDGWPGGRTRPGRLHDPCRVKPRVCGTLLTA